MMDYDEWLSCPECGAATPDTHATDCINGPDTVVVADTEWKRDASATREEQMWNAHDGELSVDNARAGEPWGWTIWGQSFGSQYEPPYSYEIEEGVADTRDEAMTACVAAYDRMVTEEREAEEAMEREFAEWERQGQEAPR